MHYTTLNPSANPSLTVLHPTLPNFTAAPHNRSLPNPCTIRRQNMYKQTTSTRAFLPRPHVFVAAPPHCHISVLRRIGMTPEPTPHAPQNTVRRARQSVEQDIRRYIPATWAWGTHVSPVALSCSCRNKQPGHMPPQQLMPNTVNNRYNRQIPPRTGALRTRYDTWNVPAETRHPQV